LAGEKGLQCIRELTAQRLNVSSVETRKGIFQNEILPFLETITHPNVLASLVLEKSVGTIYSFVFGIEGKRAGETRQSNLEVSLIFFSRIVELNSTAFVQ
jgi:hypothetical protein